MCERVALALVGKYENVRKGVETVMTGRVLDYEAKDILREGIRTGEEKGKKEGKEEGTLTTLVHGVRRKLEKIRARRTRRKSWSRSFPAFWQLWLAKFNFYMYNITLRKAHGNCCIRITVPFLQVREKFGNRYTKDYFQIQMMNMVLRHYAG